MILVFKKGHKISEEQKRMMRKRMTGKKNPFYGKTHSEKTKKILRERVYSEETRKRIGLAGMGRKHSEETKRKMTGRRHTEETKRKMSKSRKGKKTGRKLSEEHKKKLTFKGRKHTKKSKKKISSAGIGRKHTEKAKKSIGLAQKGKKISEESIQKWKATMEKRFPDGRIPWHKGKTGVFSDEAIEKIRNRRATQVFPVKDTKIEKILQRLLKGIKIKFETHRMYVKRGLRILGQPDIFIKPNICIYADGDYWHANPKFYKPNDTIIGKKTAKDIWKKDKQITAKNEKQGYEVLRFWEHEINENPEKCLQKILKVIKKSRR